MTNDLLPTQADLIILLLSPIVIYSQLREIGAKLRQAPVPVALRRRLIALIKGPSNWANLAAIIGLALANALKELSQYALQRPGQAIVDLWVIREIMLIWEHWPLLPMG